MPSTSIFFSCHFCHVKAKTQTDLSTHLLFSHSFINPDCSRDIESAVEGYLNTEKHFKICIICSGYTRSICVNSDRIEIDKLGIRSMSNYFCSWHYDIFEKGQQAERSDTLNSLKKESKQRYFSLRKYYDAIWLYFQSIPIQRVRMHQRTLVNIHVPLPMKPSKKSSGNFINQRYWGKEKRKRIDASRIG